MKTAIRTTVHKSQAGPYNLMYIEILVPRYGGTKHLEPAGTITFQQTIGEDTWYGMNFEIRTDSVSKLKKFTKLATFVKKNSDFRYQPDQVKELIVADEHVHYQGEFVPLSKNGQKYYKVMTSDGGFYSSIIAPDEKAAQKELKKLNIANSSLEFKHEVVL